jgi:hypothetical protein
MRWVVIATPWPLDTRERDPVTILQEAGWTPRAGLDGWEKSQLTRIRSPDCPARSELLYRSYFHFFFSLQRAKIVKQLSCIISQEMYVKFRSDCLRRFSRQLPHYTHTLPHIHIHTRSPDRYSAAPRQTIKWTERYTSSTELIRSLQLQWLMHS